MDDMHLKCEAMICMEEVMLWLSLALAEGHICKPSKLGDHVGSPEYDEL